MFEPVTNVKLMIGEYIGRVISRTAPYATIFVALLVGCSNPSKSSSGVAEKPDNSHPHLTNEFVAKIPDDKVVGQLTDMAYTMVEGVDDLRAACLKMPPGMQVLYTTTRADSEVNNGGFHQFFWNSSGTLADITLAGFQALGDHERENLLREAITIHEVDERSKGSEQDKNDITEFQKSEKMSKLGPLDDKYYKIKVTLTELQLKYIRAHPEKFSSK